MKRLRGAPLRDRLLFRRDIDENGCWRWTGAHVSGGYGSLRIGDRTVSVHRAAYEEFVGPIPEGLEIDHLCFVRDCFNPEHLDVVDRRTNVLRGQRNQNHDKTHCVHGHEFTEENTHVDGRGNRVCRACGRERMRRWRGRNG